MGILPRVREMQWASRRVQLPWMLRNWPNFNAAPRIRDNLSTNRETLVSLMNKELLEDSSEVVLRRINSSAAPNPIPAARPANER